MFGEANLQWVVIQTLYDWVHESILAGHSVVALCWVTAENKPLALYHRNRSIQIRRAMNIENLYHLGTEWNPRDIGTRPERVKIADMGPGSRWEEGDPWMKLEFT